MSSEVRAFLSRHIDAPEHLDILLLLHREPDRQWSGAEVAQAVYTVASSAERRLERLVTDGLAGSSGGAAPRYRYQPTSDAQRRLVEQVADAYRADRAGLIRLVLDRTGDPIRQFSEAFRLRRDDH